MIYVKRHIVIFVNSGHAACFEHAIIKTCEFHDMGNEVIMVIEGSATASIGEYSEEGRPYPRAILGSGRKG